MKKIRCLVFILIFSLRIYSQEAPSTEEELEEVTEQENAEPEDDSYLEDLEHYRKHPLNLNAVDANDLSEFKILSALQLQHFISYMKFYGPLSSIFELQAIPSWDIRTIRKLLPFIAVGIHAGTKEIIQERLIKGEHLLIGRFSQQIQKSKGYSGDPQEYLGNRSRVFFKYKYKYGNLLQFGITADKDAGEQFFTGAQKQGFDFYSMHLHVGKIGIIQSLVLGDFALNMGQGLIQWQGLAFNKSSQLTAMKRQSPVIRPYSSSGEFNFHRGIGICIRKNGWQFSGFVSFRKLSANFIEDSALNEKKVSSISASGYHRTANEVNDRNRLKQFAYGGSAAYANSRLHINVNFIQYRFSERIQKRPEPYNLFSVKGNQWSNISLAYAYTFRNFHFFGEEAVDMYFKKAFVNAVIFSVDPKVDISILHRDINKEYQSFGSNAFSEHSTPTNEQGLFAGITIRPTPAWKMEAFCDVFRFPWLSADVDAPGNGKDFMVQLSYLPTRMVEISSRYRSKLKSSGRDLEDGVTVKLVGIPRKTWRTQLMMKMSRVISVKSRVELVWFDKKGMVEETGFLEFLEFAYLPMKKPYSGNLRLQFFETGGYNSRIYAYESDVLYFNSIPVFFDRGFRYYINIMCRLGKNINSWVKWSSSLYPGKKTIGSGPDVTDGNRRSDLRIQISLNF